MEEIELEEGQAFSYRGEVEKSTIDPEVALSYIGEKLQNVLGHFQKDFEGGVSAENLGAKFGGYGSFLPTYQLSPTWSRTKKTQSEDERQTLLASSSASPMSIPCDVVPSNVPMGNSLKGNMHFPFVHVDGSSFKCGVIEKSVNPSDQRTLKVRIKVGSEKSLNQKNAEIYSGLGLVVSPSSSLDDSPTTGERMSGDLLDVSDGSPTSILQIMTSIYAVHLLSPLSDDLICLTENQALRSNSKSHVNTTNAENYGMLVNGSLSSRSDQKVLEPKNSKSPEIKSLSKDLTNQKNISVQNNSFSVRKKEKETEIDAIDCDELVSNALKLPLLSNSPDTTSDAVKGMSTARKVQSNDSEVKVEASSRKIEKKHMDSESAEHMRSVEKLGERLGSTGKVLESGKGNLVSSGAACTKDGFLNVAVSRASDQSTSNVSKERKAPSALSTDPLKQFVFHKAGLGSEEGLQSAFEKSSSEGQRKLKACNDIGSQGSYILRDQPMIDSSLSTKSWKRSNAVVNNHVPKNDLCHLQKDPEILQDMHRKDFLEELGIEDGSESIPVDSGRLKGPLLVGKRRTSEFLNISQEKTNDRSAENHHPSEKDFRLASHVATPGNGPNSEVTTGMAPVLNEDWVRCDKCKKWRLLPLGTNPKCLPKKWRCKMLTWLPGKNRCTIPEEETTGALRSLCHSFDLFGPDSVRQRNQLYNSVETSIVGIKVDASCPGQGHQNISALSQTISEKKYGTEHAENSTDMDIMAHSLNARKKLLTSAENSKLNQGNHSPLDSCGFQNLQQSNNEVEKQNSNNKREPLVDCSGSGINLKIRNKLDSDVDGSRASKRTKEDAHSEDEQCSENIGASLKIGSISIKDLSNNTSGSDRHMHMDSSIGDGKKNAVCTLSSEIHIPGTSDGDLTRKFDCKDSIKKRKGKEHHDSQIQTKPLSSLLGNDQNTGNFVDEKWDTEERKKKKARVSKSGGKDTNGSKSRADIKGKDRGTNHHHDGQYLSKIQGEDYLKKDREVQLSVVVNSSSSKVSSSHKNTADVLEVKVSSVESVSSSPLRHHKTDKVTLAKGILVGKDDFQNSYSSTATSPRCLGGENGGNERTGIIKEDATLVNNDHEPDVYTDPICQGNQLACEKYLSEQKKLGKSSSSYATEKTRTSRSDLDKYESKASDSSHDYLDNSHTHDEETKSRRNKFNERSGTSGMTEKFICKTDTAGGMSSVSSKGKNQTKIGGCDGQDVIKNQDKNNIHFQDRDSEKLLKKSCLTVTNGNGKAHSLPPLSRVQTETVVGFQHVSGSEKENGVTDFSIDAFHNDDASKAQSKIAEKKNDQTITLRYPTSKSHEVRDAEASSPVRKDSSSHAANNAQTITLRHPTPKSHKVRDAEASSPVRKDSSSHAANNALKEAKDLKHLADRLKNSGSMETNGFYFEAALKFLHGASLLEILSNEGSKHNDLMHSMRIYSSTAKLCEFCAHEFEKSKDMAAAALAYKCMEVAYMRVIYSSHSSAGKDRNELLTALQIIPSGESPFSSASDVDNLNHATADKTTASTKVVGSPHVSAKVVGSPQVSGSHIITSRDRSGLVRLLNFAQDVNLAMEASRKSRNAFTAAISKLGETDFCSLRKALDFNFQDVDGLLRLVRVSMESINR